MNSIATRIEDREEPACRPGGPIIYRSEAIRRVLDDARVVAATDATALILGETGVGKGLFAQAIHYASPQRHRPMVRVSCAARPATLVESELFGYERGAFTGAVSRHLGRFETAHGSTLFLDDIGELSPAMQGKLLRVLEERTIERLGSHVPIKVDIRFIAATHRNLEEAVRENRFRADLFYRLNVFPITIPPLRERREDITLLAWTFIAEFSRRIGKTIDAIASHSLRDLQLYSWPGNVRELRDVIERAMIAARTSTLAPVVPSPHAGGLRRERPAGRRRLRPSTSHRSWTAVAGGSAAGAAPRSGPGSSRLHSTREWQSSASAEPRWESPMMSPPSGSAMRVPHRASAATTTQGSEAVIRRVRAEYREMPGLCLTIPQACRLWQIDTGTCTQILDVLVAERFLTRTPKGAFIINR
jgi:DNA-binding NtrC family response regulator